MNNQKLLHHWTESLEILAHSVNTPGATNSVRTVFAALTGALKLGRQKGCFKVDVENSWVLAIISSSFLWEDSLCGARVSPLDLDLYKHSLPWEVDKLEQTLSHLPCPTLFPLTQLFYLLKQNVTGHFISFTSLAYPKKLRIWSQYFTLENKSYGKLHPFSSFIFVLRQSLYVALAMLEFAI